MKVYFFKRQQVLPITLDEAWCFFSSPANLAKITPPGMRFRLDSISGDANEMYEGQLMTYTLNVIPGIDTFWMTEITHVHEPYYFVDEQRFGPYALWNHQHRFREVTGGIEVTDDLTYALPFGFIGQIANALFVEKQIRQIFDFRREALSRLFSVKMVVNQTA
jgi:ligand-binding SRPBCC domain-containing protein